MNPGDWTNAVKAAVVAVVNTGVALIIATAVMLGVTTDAQQVAVITASIDAFVNAALSLWIVLSYKNSPTRATERTLKARSGSRGLSS